MLLTLLYIRIMLLYIKYSVTITRDNGKLEIRETLWPHRNEYWVSDSRLLRYIFYMAKRQIVYPPSVNTWSILMRDIGYRKNCVRQSKKNRKNNFQHLIYFYMWKKKVDAGGWWDALCFNRILFFLLWFETAYSATHKNSASVSC